MSAITVISILGVSLGVTVLIVVIAVMTGFDRMLQKAILGFEPHLRVTNGEILKDWSEDISRIESVDGVIGVAPYVMGPVLIEHEGRVNPAVIRGVNLSQEGKLIDLEKVIKGMKKTEGKFEMESDTVLLGRALASDLGAVVGDEVTIYAPGNIKGILEEIRRDSDDPAAKPRSLADLKEDVVIPSPMKVVGLLDSGTNSFDSNFILTTLHNAQELYSLRGGVHGLAVKTRDPYALSGIRKNIEDALDGRAYTISWFDENRQRLEAVQTERVVMFIILFVTVVIATFSIMNTIITVTVQKTREIGVLKALGATQGQIVWVFLNYGMVIGAMGTLIGMANGLGILRLRNVFRDWLASTLHMEIFPAGIYEFSGIPAVIRWQDITIICVGAFVLCSVAALIPAYLAARLDPVKALRTE